MPPLLETAAMVLATVQCWQRWKLRSQQKTVYPGQRVACEARNEGRASGATTPLPVASSWAQLFSGHFFQWRSVHCLGLPRFVFLDWFLLQQQGYYGQLPTDRVTYGEGEDSECNRATAKLNQAKDGVMRHATGLCRLSKRQLRPRDERAAAICHSLAPGC